MTTGSMLWYVMLNSTDQQLVNICHNPLCILFDRLMLCSLSTISRIWISDVWNGWCSKCRLQRTLC